MVIRAFVVVVLISMFIGGAFMIAEGSKNDPASEPNKMYFGIAHLLAASFIAALYIYGLS